MGRLSWITQVESKCNHMHPLTRKLEEDLTHRREDDVTMEKAIRVIQPQAKECWPLAEAVKGREGIHHYKCQRECIPANTLISA